MIQSKINRVTNLLDGWFNLLFYHVFNRDPSRDEARWVNAQQYATDIAVEIVCHRNLEVSQRPPETIASACCWVACQHYGLPVTQRMVSMLVGRTECSVRSNIKIVRGIIGDA